MMKKKLAATLSGAAVAVLALAAGGCATVQPKAPDEIVKNLAEERWKMLIGGETEKAYAMLAPSYRKINSLTRYRSTFGGGVQWVGAEVVRVECEEQKCNARLKITAKPFIGGKVRSTFDTAVDESWVLEDGQWWYFQRLD